MSKNIKIGLALGGGGARGSYQIGVISALEEEGLFDKIKYVSGTSIGAINTIMIMSGYSQSDYRKVWDMIDGDEIFGHGLSRYKKDKKGLFSIQTLFEKLSVYVDVDKIRNSHIHGFATLARINKKFRWISQLNTLEMKKEVIYLNESKNPLMSALASASIPVLFGPTQIEDKLYVDGGMIDNCPVRPLVDSGCDIIFVVPLAGGYTPNDYQVEKITFVNLESEHIFSTIPLVGLIDQLMFSPDNVEKKARHAYHMTKLMISKLRDNNIIKGKEFVAKEMNLHFKISSEEELEIKKLVEKEMKDNR